ncbi:MAG: response regulator transcription factor [Chloroflexi bacterium]|nr:response regulator transcription factor [Chloroflexota bacterium]
MSAIRVLVADDHALFRQGICALLARRKGIEVVGEAENGEQAVAQVAALRPDVVLMDIAMPVMNGVQATQQIHQEHPETRVLVLTQYESREYVFSLLRAGAAGYVPKLTRIDELVDAIRAVHTKGAFLQSDVLHAVVETIDHAPPAEAEAPPTLTEREKQIVRLIAEGMTGREIADRLCISVKTVVTHRANIMEKIGAHSTAELIRYAIREEIVRA